MLKKACCFVIVLMTILLLCSSCQNAPLGENDLQANAYLELFKYMTADILKNEHGYEYVAIDMTGVLYEHPDSIQRQIEEYMRKSKITLLWDNMGGLIESGHIVSDDLGNPGYFDKGFLVSFNDIEFTKTMLKTDAMKWHGNLGASGAVYTVEKDAGKWTVVPPETLWIS